MMMVITDMSHAN